MTTPSQRDPLDVAIESFKNAVTQNMEPKQIQLMARWLTSWAFYIKREKRFRPHENIKYNAGDIVTVCYGYTVGSEQGGNRPSVVIEDNDHSDKTVMVVPLSSLEPGESVHVKNVYLGELREYNIATNKLPGTESIALTHQMRTVSKQRIIKPVKNTDAITTLDPQELEKIYNKIFELYASKITPTEEPIEAETTDTKIISGK